MNHRPLLTFASVLLTASSAAAEERVLVLVQEHDERGPARTQVAEARLAERLIGAGHRVVEAVETERARAHVSIDKLLGGGAGFEATALEADVLVVGRTSTTAEEIPYGVSDIAAASAEWTVRAVTVDTGRVLATAAGRVAGAGTQHASAALDARKKAADAMFDAIGPSLGARGGTDRAAPIVLTIAGLRELQDVERVRGDLSALPSVAAVVVRHVAHDETRLDVTPRGVDLWSFAASLKSLGLDVATLSRGAIRAAWSPWGQGRRLVVASFDNRTGQDRLDWIQAMLPEVFETELANSRTLRVVATTPRPRPADTTADTLRAVAREAKADLVALATLERIGDKLRLAVSIHAADGASVTAAQAFGGDAELVERARELAWAVDERVFARLFQGAALAPYEPIVSARRAASTGGGTAPGATAPASGRSVAVVEVALDNLYPSRLAAYATRPIGKLVLAGAGERVATDVRVRVHLPRLMATPAIIRVDDLPPGARREVPIVVALDRDKVLALGDNTPVQAEISVSAATERGESADVFTVPLVVFEKSALDWTAPESVAAFTTHRDPSLEALARAALDATRATRDAVPAALATPLVLFEALGLLGLGYQADATNPFGATRLDTVAFPAETLTRKVGDCDDLSVLFAALLESQGIATAFLLTPGHVLVAWDSGVLARSADKLGLPAGGWIERGGKAWIPIEPTRVGASFGEAIAAGAAEVARHRDVSGGLSIVVTAEAWRTFPPFPGALGSPALTSDALPGLADRVAASAASLTRATAERDLAPLPEPGAIDDASELNRVAVLLVQRGQWRRAATYLDRARALRSDRHAVAYNLANLRVIEGRRDEARVAFEALRGVSELERHSLYALGIVAYLDGQARDAKSLIERSALPEAGDALRRLGLATRPRPTSPKRPTAPPPPDPFLGVRAGVERVPVDELLLWLP